MSTKQETLTLTPSPTQEPSQLPNDLLEAISIYTDKRKKPKRNRSAFILFSIDVRNKHLYEDLDELNPNDKFVKIAQLWKEISEEERKLYKEKANKEKERYASELNDFCKIFPSEPIQRPRNHIKKPCNAYGYFLKEIKEEIKKENPEMRMCEVLRVVGEKWKTLGSAEKERFEKKAEISRKQFKEEVSKQNPLVKKVKTEKGETAVKVKSPQAQKQEDLVCKDPMIDELENEEFEPRLRRSTSTDKNFLVNSRMKQEFTETTNTLASSPTLQVDALNTLLSMQAYQPGMGMMLERLYWKVEGLRQQIISQIQAVASGRQAESIYFDGIPLFGQNKTGFDGKEKKEEC